MARIVAGNNGSSLLSVGIDGQIFTHSRHKPPHETDIKLKPNKQERNTSRLCMEKGKKQQKYERLSLGRKMFLCKHCNREFLSPQALGGHQNAHRRDRSMSTHCSRGRTTAPHQEPCDFRRWEETEDLDLELKL